MFYINIENVDGEDETLIKTINIEIIKSYLIEHQDGRIQVCTEPINYMEDDYEEQ